MLLERLGIDLPIIQAPMAGVSTPSMAAAVSNCGALGSIAIGASDLDAACKMIAQTKDLTDRPFNVNVFCHQPAVADRQKELTWLSHLEPYFSRFASKPPSALTEIYKSFIEDQPCLELLLDLKPKVVSFHFGRPPETFILRLKAQGIVLLATATSLEEATLIASQGIDAVVAQGYEAGGHRGTFDPARADLCLSTACLTRLIASKLKIPVIAAGGIMDGAGVVASLELGAQAAQLGTAFVLCAESLADQFYREAMQSQAAYSTVMTRGISGRPARCLENSFTRLAGQYGELPDYPIAYDAGKALNAAAKKAGDGSFGAQWAGQGAPLARALKVQDLIEQLKEEMKR